MTIFLVTSLIGILFISLAVYRASKELEIIHEIDTMHRLVHALLGDAGNDNVIQRITNLPESLTEAGYRFYLLSDNVLRPLHTHGKHNLHFPGTFNLEETRINQHGGYLVSDGEKLFTWIDISNYPAPNAGKLIMLHRFESEGASALTFVYQKRIIIPAAFYLWLMLWVSLIFNHLYRKIKKQQQQIRQLALHDSLTGLPNRKLMEDRLGELIKIRRRDKKKFAFALLDMDNFKAINDNYGHRYGDELLRQVARRLERIIRESDTAARLGGDEFTLILDDYHEVTSNNLFDRLLKTLAEPYTLYDKITVVRASIGIAIFPDHGEDAESLVHNADKAMYSIKSEGGGLLLCGQNEIGTDEIHSKTD